MGVFSRLFGKRNDDKINTKKDKPHKFEAEIITLNDLSENTKFNLLAIAETMKFMNLNEIESRVGFGIDVVPELLKINSDIDIFFDLEPGTVNRIVVQGKNEKWDLSEIKKEWPKIMQNDDYLLSKPKIYSIGDVMKALQISKVCVLAKTKLNFKTPLKKD
jgi:hypothetical protein